MKKILITGSEGFIGQKMSLFYVNKKLNVYGSYYKNKIKKIKGVKYIKCNFKRKFEIENLINKIKPNYIFHLAAKSHPTYSFKNPISTVQTNFIGTFYLLNAIKKLNLNTKIIIAGSSAQFGIKKLKELPVSEKANCNPEHIYGFTKKIQVSIGELYYKMYNMKICSAIIFNTSGLGKNFDVFQDFCNQYIKKNKKKEIVLNVGNVNNQRDFLHIDDVVNALDKIRLKGKSGKKYIISSNKLTKIKTIIDNLQKVTKKKIKLKINKKLLRKFDEKIILGNNKEIKKLGWKPKKNITDIIKDIINE